MKYFHCPILFRNKPYGCGAGPFNATQAFLDLGNACPKCKKALKPHAKRDAQQTHRENEARSAVAFIKNTFGDAAALSYAATKGVKL
jgi:hypothetical protein